MIGYVNWYSTGVKTSERYEYNKEITQGFNAAPDKVHFSATTKRGFHRGNMEIINK